MEVIITTMEDKILTSVETDLRRFSSPRCEQGGLMWPLVINTYSGVTSWGNIIFTKDRGEETSC
jgi:hypothetical protein